jgi:hypothetical protein
MSDFLEMDESANNTTDTTIHAQLARRKQIAVIWGVEDVQENRPDLDDDQAWQVLLAVKRGHDCNDGINWDTLQMTAEMLFPEPEGDAG